MRNPNDLFNADALGQLSPEEILEGGIGIEREGLRVNGRGELALTPHPAVFEPKLTNPYVTTDFSESQIEIVTPTGSSPEETYHLLSALTTAVHQHLNEGELYWPQSVPGIVPEEALIPIADYGSGEAARKAMAYREGLARRYGKKKQLISGIHFNFSFSDATLKKLWTPHQKEMTFKDYKDGVYLKIVRNYLRHRWFVIYLMSASVGADDSFTSTCLSSLSRRDGHGASYWEYGMSLRNSDCGYRNINPLFPRYDSVAHFTSDIRAYIKGGLLSEAKELYTQIRMKPKDVGNLLDSLEEDGIQYVETRTIDLNPFDPCGIAEDDIAFMRLFMIYLFAVPETPYENWQIEGLTNENSVSTRGLDPGLSLQQDGESINLFCRAKQIIREMQRLNRQLNLGCGDIIKKAACRVDYPDRTYARRLMRLIEEEGYLAGQLRLAKSYHIDFVSRPASDDPTIQTMLNKTLTGGQTH